MTHTTSTPPPPAPRSRSALAVVYLAVFIDLLGFGIILPALPYYADSFGAGGLGVGLILTAYSGLQFVGSPLLGRLSDRWGRRPILLASLAGASLSFLFTGLAGTLAMLVAARAAAGLFGGSIATAQAYVADVTAPDERAKFMGILGASIGLGFVFGPAIGSVLSRWGFSTAAFVAAGLAALNFLAALVFLKESRPAHERKPSERGRFGWSQMQHHLGPSPSGRVIQTMFLATLAFVAMETAYPLLGKAQFGLNEIGLGWILSFVGVVVVIVQGGLIGRAVGRFGEARTAAAGALLMAAGLALLPFAPSLTTSVVALGVLAAGQGFVSPSLSTLLSRHAPAGHQGAVLGVGQGMAALARAVGPLLAGALFDLRMDLPFWGAGLGIAFGGWLLLRPLPSVSGGHDRETLHET